jgi:hypothetical protein
MFWILLPSFVTRWSMKDTAQTIIKHWWCDSWFGAIFHLYDLSLLVLIIVGSILSFPVQNAFMVSVLAGLKLVLVSIPYVFIILSPLRPNVKYFTRDDWVSILSTEDGRHYLQTQITNWRALYWSFSLISCLASFGFTFQHPSPFNAPLWLLAMQIQTFVFFSVILFIVLVGLGAGILWLTFQMIKSCHQCLWPDPYQQIV